MLNTTSPQVAVINLPIHGIVNGVSVVTEHTTVLDDDFSTSILLPERWTLAGGMGSRPTRYAACHRNGTTVYLHRLIYCHYFGELPDGVLVDHRDRNRLNNLPSNLRLADRSINAANQQRKSHPSSGIRGVYQISRSRRWYARIMHMNKFKHLGSFETSGEAARAVNDAYRLYFPGVAVPNPDYDTR